MDSKPIVTYAGDLNLFHGLEAALIEALPKETAEWQRPYGRITKSVHIEAKFIPFSAESVSKQEDFKLINKPLLHTYWIECNDIETYKTSVKEELEQWHKSLSGADWMIILVEVYDIRKSNKLLPRTTVLDKIRQEFALKQGDRVISLIHPIKSESKSAESWRGLVNRIRVLLLQSYSKTLSRFEETVRKNRECRPLPTWSFCNYFLMQEEMALVLEMLGLYEEALVQYDELDALFTQFILNSTKGENPKWLNSFRVPLQQWAGPNLKQKVTQAQRDLIKCSKLDLLQFRSYLFGRQCALLLLEKKPWEMAQRALSFLHNCVNELHILEVTAPEGAIACWIFLVCLEVLYTCENYNGTAHIEAYSLYTAGLWSYARDKLKELGELCGLTPCMKPTSEQLHTVVGLSSGMGDSCSSDPQRTPVDRLKEALSSKDAYNNYFLELSELSISTFKHIGRMRSARLVGADLAKFYLALGQPDKAITFLTGALGGYLDDHWSSLAADTQLQIVECCSSSPIDVKYITSCAAVASSDLDHNTKLKYFNKFIDSLNNIEQDKNLVSNLDDIGDALSVKVQEVNRLKEGESEICGVLEFRSRLPEALTCKRVSISLEKELTENNDKMSSRKKGSSSSKNIFRKLPLMELLNYKQDRNLNAANIVYDEPQKVLRRVDSHGRGRKLSVPLRNDFTICFTSENISLNPGINEIPLTWKTNEVGKYRLGQISALLDGLELLGPVPSPIPHFFVTREKSSVQVKQRENELLAGLEQVIDLIVSSGSYAIEKGTTLVIKCSDGLEVMSDLTDECPVSSTAEISLPHIKPFDLVTLPLRVLAKLPPQREKDPTAINHKMILSCQWCKEEMIADLKFQAPLKSVMRLHTALYRKFLQVTVTGLSSCRLMITSAQLIATNTDLPVIKSLKASMGQPQVIENGLNLSLLWELDISNFQNLNDVIKLDFSMDYSPVDSDTQDMNIRKEVRNYKCHFDLQNYKTLFVVTCSLEPGKDTDFCRVGTMCQLHLEVLSFETKTLQDISLMYEVIADATMWAVCGRAAGDEMKYIYKMK
ncbi:hypothetical protein RUM44_012960 [Polyplax serrata]|uniref:Trafficking protein particle complex subunit 10 n=1 Tax=Polyplax serrata TaxID=468196 RepID=A0ABR1BCT3_POLSC